MQIYVARRRTELDRAILEALRNEGATFEQMEWLAPVENLKFSEPCDGRFLDLLGLSHLRSKLLEFWPKGGPRWDALALLHPGEAVLLVEAKSYPSEVHGGGCKANPIARPKIEESLHSARRWLGASTDSDWLGPLYQYANRLSHVYFLRHNCNCTAWLANICFINDPRSRTSKEEWNVALPQLKKSLGFSDGSIPHVIDVFLQGRNREELFGTI